MSSIPGIGTPDPYQPTDPQIYQQFEREAPQIEARKLQLMDVAGKLAGEGAVPTGGSLNIPTQQVAQFDPLQQQGFTQTTQGLGSFMPYMGAATDALNIAGGAQYDPSSYQQYMNPYQTEVIGGIESQFDKLQNEANKRAIQTGSFGGAREGITTAELGRQRAQAVGQAQAQNYQQAQQASRGDFENQMARYAAAGQASAGLGQQMQQQIQQDVASTMASGSVQQQRAQQMADASYRQQIQQSAEPYQRLGFVSDIYSRVPSTQMATTMGTSPMTNPLSQVLGGGIMGLGMYQGYGGGQQ